MPKHIVFILIASLFLASCPALAQSPVLPMAFYGTIKINNQDATNAIVRAYNGAGDRIDYKSGGLGEISITSTGLYGTNDINNANPAETRLLVVGTGTIFFKAIIIGYKNEQEITAKETATFSAGVAKRQDLTFTASATSAPQVCSITTVANGVVGAYPGCVITCNSGYTLSGNTCVVITTPPSSSPSSSPSTDDTDDTDDTSTIIGKKDMTDDGKIDFDDFSIFALLYGKSYTDAEEKIQDALISWADYDDNGKIDFTDFAEFALSYGK